jgi:hypothetical protein
MDVTEEVGTPAINEQQVHEFLSGLFAEDLHAKRVLSLFLATLGVIHAASLSVQKGCQTICRTRGIGTSPLTPSLDIISDTISGSRRLPPRGLGLVSLAP